jgi:CRP-like cAMP-binding protein
MIRIMSLPIQRLWGAEARERSLSAGEVLFRAGDTVRWLYWVESGSVRLVRPLEHGTELTIQQARAGAILAEASLFAATYHCDAVAVHPSRLRGLQVRRIKEVLGRDAELACAFTEHLAHEVQAARARAEIVGLKTVRGRLKAWLELNGGSLPPKGQWRGVAGEIGVTPEALYRELARNRL